MKRRAFLKLGAAGGALLDTGKAAGRAEKMERIGCTTTSFNDSFPASRKKELPKLDKPQYELLDMPALMADLLGVHNVQIVGPHFAEQTLSYADKLRRAAEKAKSRIINISANGPFDLSSPDPEYRKKCIADVKAWMDITRSADCPTFRPNTGPLKAQRYSTKGLPPMDLKVTGDSFQQLAEYGEKIGVKVLVENHGGYSSDSDYVLAIVKNAGRNCGTLPDFGNFEEDISEPERHRFLKAIFPHAYLVSAKGMYFDENNRHISYDYGACVRLGEQCGFKGVYSAEFWTPKAQKIDPWVATKIIIDMTLENLA